MVHVLREVIFYDFNTRFKNLFVTVCTTIVCVCYVYYTQSTVFSVTDFTCTIHSPIRYTNISHIVLTSDFRTHCYVM